MSIQNVPIQLHAAHELKTSPVNSIPVEILAEIFRMCLPDNFSGTIQLPPKVGAAPWILGHICSLWREVSRSDPLLWPRAVIYLISPRSVKGRLLERACSMLPQHTTLSVTHWANSSENHTTKLLPYIGRIQELKLRMTVEDYTDLWQMLSPTQLANLTSLHLGFPDTEVLQTAVQDWRSVTLFKLVKRLRRLALTSPQDFTPTLLSLDVPWGQLIELHIDLENLSFQTAVSILQKSSALEGLVLRVYESEEAVGDFISGRILLPHLKTLRITVNDASMFHALIVPTLTSLHITETQMNSQDLSPDILHFLATSGCSLTSFTYKRATRSPCPLTLLRDLLGVLHGVTRFAAPDVMFCEEVMRDFACCALLPRVQDLGFCAPTREALVHMLEQRMQVEAKRGAVTLRRVNGTDHDRAHGPLRSTLFFYTLAGTSYS